MRSVSDALGDGRQIYGLDLVRFFAALLVAFYHLGFTAWARTGDPIGRLIGRPEHYPTDWPLTASGFVGVQIFFVLSGFVIAYSAERSSPYSFFVSRTRRLLPGLWICALLAAAIGLSTGLLDPQQATVRLLKSISFYPIGPYISGTMWTLPVEVSFYILVWFVLTIDGLKWTDLLAGLMAGASVLYWAVMTFHHPANISTGSRFTQLVLLQHGLYFSMGLVLWRVARSGWSAVRLLIVAFCIGGAIPQISSATIAEGLNLVPGPRISPVEPIIVWLLAMFLMYASIRWNSILAERLHAFGPAIRSLGLMTYPLYLIHIHVGGVTMALLFRSGLSAVISMLGGVIAAVGAAWILATFPEPWLQRRVSRVVGSFGAVLRRSLGEDSFLFRKTAPVE